MYLLPSWEVDEKINATLWLSGLTVERIQEIADPSQVTVQAVTPTKEHSTSFLKQMMIKRNVVCEV